MAFRFKTTERDLALALFYGASLSTKIDGETTQTEAFEQARVMLAGEVLLAACENALRWGENAVRIGCDDEETAAYAVQNHHILVGLRAAISLAKDGV